jgi:hypothetical protein
MKNRTDRWLSSESQGWKLKYVLSFPGHVTRLVGWAPFCPRHTRAWLLQMPRLSVLDCDESVGWLVAVKGMFDCMGKVGIVKVLLSRCSVFMLEYWWVEESVWFLCPIYMGDCLSFIQIRLTAEKRLWQMCEGMFLGQIPEVLVPSIRGVSRLRSRGPFRSDTKRFGDGDFFLSTKRNLNFNNQCILEGVSGLCSGGPLRRYIIPGSPYYFRMHCTCISAYIFFNTVPTQWHVIISL